MKKSDEKIKSALSDFLKQDQAYRNKFLQSNYNTAFDGYSYIGQQDSLNQYATDMLHSFVLSEFQELNRFPKEFHHFLEAEWESLKALIRKIESEAILKLNKPVLSQLYEQDALGYMMSCNYYPSRNNCNFVGENNSRLSTHKDVSLFSVFPYGLAKGLSYYDEKEDFIELDEQEKVMLFPGYFMEYATGNEIPALNHGVSLPKDMDEERYSFAVFSIPKPNTIFWLGDKKIKSEDYYQAYLSLF